MKRLLFLLLSVAAFGQGARFDSVASTTKTVAGQTVSTPASTPVITVCTAAATGIPCSPQILTYTDSTLGTPCAGSTQVTLPGSSICQSNGDTLGNFGFWVTPGNYKYTVSGTGIAGQSYNVTLPIITGGAATLGALTASSATITGALTAPKINLVRYLDGTTFPQTLAGLNSALADACPGSVAGWVVIPPSVTLNLSSAVTIPSNCHLSGGGKDMTIINETSGSNLATLITAANGATNITIDNLTIDCNQANNTGAGQTGGCVLFPGAPTHIRIHDTTIRNFFAVTGSTVPCLSFAGLGYDINVNDNFIFNCGGSTHAADGVYVSGNQVRIENNTFDTISDTGAVCEAFNDCTITGNSFINNNSAIAASGLVTGNPSFGVSIVGNTINNSNNTTIAAIAIENVAPGTMRASTVSGNTVHDTTSGACIFAKKVYDLTLSDNTCENISVASTNQPIGFLVQDSSLIRISGGGVTRAGGSGLQLQGVQNVTVNGGTYWMNSQQTPAASSGIFIGAGTLTISTTIAAGVGATGSQTVTPVAMTNITVGVPLLIGAGPNCSSASSECVAPTAITATTFTAVFNQTHGASVAVAEAPSNSITMTGVQSSGFTQALGLNLNGGDNIFLSGNDFRFNNTNPGLTNSATGNVRLCGNLTNNTSNTPETCDFVKVTSLTSNALLLSNTAPVILTHFNTSGDSIAASNGTASFSITVGAGAGTSTGALTLPTAATGWNCHLENQTRADQIQQTASSTTSATFTNFGTTFAATNWTNSDVLRGTCLAN